MAAAQCSCVAALSDLHQRDSRLARLDAVCRARRHRRHLSSSTLSARTAPRPMRAAASASLSRRRPALIRIRAASRRRGARTASASPCCASRPASSTCSTSPRSTCSPCCTARRAQPLRVVAYDERVHRARRGARQCLGVRLEDVHCVPAHRFAPAARARLELGGAVVRGGRVSRSAQLARRRRAGRRVFAARAAPSMAPPATFIRPRCDTRAMCRRARSALSRSTPFDNRCHGMVLVPGMLIVGAAQHCRAARAPRAVARRRRERADCRVPPRRARERSPPRALRLVHARPRADSSRRTTTSFSACDAAASLSPPSATRRSTTARALASRRPIAACWQCARQLPSPHAAR
jgi:hypothetical protein